jgi:hypothetical protein
MTQAKLEKATFFSEMEKVAFCIRDFETYSDLRKATTKISNSLSRRTEKNNSHKLTGIHVVSLSKYSGHRSAKINTEANCKSI